jgi:CHASE3 domain sensor protein
MRFTFGHRIIGGFLVTAALSVIVGSLAFIMTKDLQKVSRTIMKENVASLKAAEELELALLNQKGLISNYFLDGNTERLSTLEERKKDFDAWYKNAQKVALTAEENKILQDIVRLYLVYSNYSGIRSW